MITEFTPEQDALISLYREKWKSIALSTERIDRQNAREAVKAAYQLIGLPEPKIIFCNSPYEALRLIDVGAGIGQFVKQLENQISEQLVKQIGRQIIPQTWGYLWEQLGQRQLYSLSSEVAASCLVQLTEELKDNRLEYLRLILARDIPTAKIMRCSRLDFCISVLNCTFNFPQEWDVLQSLVKNCSWLFPLETICYVCDRPVKLAFDSEQRPHAEGEPAIQFADGYSLYFSHGVSLPEKYGILHPQRWQAQWILEEQNAELRRVLIQEIGYARICQELQATELDSWQKYTLLRIDADIDGFERANSEDNIRDDIVPEAEPVHLLKMTCPSTGFIHAMRVPPDITCAREAIRWVNWGIDPEEFSVQS
jgi:hypothetical protein